jgi:hypothetical protein
VRLNRISSFAVLFAVSFALSVPALASIFGSVRGIIHDPQHRPVQDAMVMIKAKSSDWSASTTSDSNGEFNFNAVALGEYVVTVAGQGFDQVHQNVVVNSGSQPARPQPWSAAWMSSVLPVRPAATVSP